jgi:hypothetical protein
MFFIGAAREYLLCVYCCLQLQVDDCADTLPWQTLADGTIKHNFGIFGWCEKVHVD